MDNTFPLGHIKGNPFEHANGNGGIYFTPPTDLFTGVDADSSKGTGDGQVPHQDLKGLIVPAHTHKGHITGDIHTGGTGHLTWRRRGEGTFTCWAMIGIDMTDKDGPLLLQGL